MKLRHQLEELGVKGTTNLDERKTGWEF